MTEATPGRGSSGKFERTVDTALRDAEAARLKAIPGTSYADIAAIMGYETSSGAYKAVQRALGAAVQESADELRKIELARLDDEYRRAYAIAEKGHLAHSQGRVVRRRVGETTDAEGNTVGVYEDVLDDGPNLAANAQLVRIGESRRKLLGLDAPTQVQATVTELTQADIGLAELVAEAKAANAVALTELREQA